MSCHTAQTVAGSPASLPDLRGCASSLDDSGGVCCTSGKLDDIHSSVLTTQSPSALSRYTAFARVQCGVACDQTLRSGGTQAGSAPVYSELCQDLWTYCYSTSGWTPRAARGCDKKITDEASFCDYRSRAQPSGYICVPWPTPGTRPAGTSFISGPRNSSLEARRRHRRGRRCHPMHHRVLEGEDATTGGRIGVSIMLLFLFGLSVWYYRRWKRHRAILGPAAAQGDHQGVAVDSVASSITRCPAGGGGAAAAAEAGAAGTSACAVIATAADHGSR